jgi:DNA-binding transcriptional LysR family regulator
MVIDLEDLEWLVAIVDTGSFGRAAEAVGVSQPSLSRRIAGMEKRLGAPLFSRARRQVELTEAGRVLVQEARGVLAGASAAVEAARAAARGISGTLRIGYRSAFRYDILPRAMRALAERQPATAITVSNGSVSEILDRVRLRQLDVGLVVTPIAPADLEVDVLRRLPLAVALPHGHRLEDRHTVDLVDLAGDPFIDITGEVAGYSEIVHAICAQAGFTPRVVAAVDSAELLVGCVQRGLGVALIYPDDDVPITGVTYRPIRPAGPTIQYLAVYRGENDNPALREFLGVLGLSARRG